MPMSSAATIKDFWQWAFSRLRSDVTRGALAEFIVGRLVGADMMQLGSPDREYDLRMPSGLTIEVKSSAYWQEWSTDGGRPTTPSFSGLKCRLFLAGSGFAPTAEYHADLFVLSVLGRSPLDPPRDRLDPLDLDQWEFYVVTRAEFEAAGRPDRISLYAVRARGKPCSWRDLRVCVSAAEAADVRVK